MRHYPVFVQTCDKIIIIVGGGEVALAKLRLLRKTEARLVVFAPQADPQIQADAAAGALVWHARAPVACDMFGALLVYAASEDAEHDAHVAAMARRAGVLVNIVDDLSSDFFSAAIVDRDPVTIAIGTEGAAPVLARRIKTYNEKALSAHVGRLAQLASDFRPRLQQWSSERRRMFWGDFWDGRAENVMQHISQHDVGGDLGTDAGTDAATNAVMRLLQQLYQRYHPKHCVRAELRHSTPQVSMLGIHTHEPDMLSVRAHKRLDQADVVVFDDQVPWSIQELARREATHWNVDRIIADPHLLFGSIQQHQQVVLLHAGTTFSGVWQTVQQILGDADIVLEHIVSTVPSAPQLDELSHVPVLRLKPPRVSQVHRVAS